MASSINPGSDEKQKTLISAQSDIEKEIRDLKHKIKTTATDVGENFSTEARAMHYGEKKKSQ